MASLTLVTPPGDLAEEMLQSVCDHLRRFADLAASPGIAPPDLAYIRELTKAAVALVDGPKGRLGRCLLTQTWKLLADGFMPDIVLPLPPVQSVVSLRHLDEAGAWQTLDPSAYRLTGAGSWAAELCPAYGTSWPSARGHADCVEIIFETGYGESMSDVPAQLLHAIRLLVAHWYLERQAVTFSTPHEIPIGIKSLLNQFRVYR
jgi:uncharacterized phiE125 gp8 family phage protein